MRRRYYIGQKLKRLGSYALIVVLLPYVITVFMNGPSIVVSSHVDETMVKVGEEAEPRVERQETQKSDVGEQDAQEQGDSEAEQGSQVSGSVVEMSIREYCVGLLAKEIPPSYEQAALRAQAILVRTDVYRKIKEKGSDTVLTESYWSRKDMEKAWGAKAGSYYRKLQGAWDDTEGQVLLYEEELAYTPFFRLSNGSTRDAKEVLGTEDYPYLKVVDCPLDIEAKEQIQTQTVDMMEAEVTKTDTAGYVLQVKVGEEEVNGEEFRDTYGLASSCFSLQEYNEKLRITSRGVGHGLGMSQYTANQMAKKGKKEEEILTFFFEGCNIQEVADIVLDSENE